jgi:hypothetical protein
MLIKIIKKRIKDKLRRWHEKLLEALCNALIFERNIIL